jgi:hypothetical protein
MIFVEIIGLVWTLLSAIGLTIILVGRWKAQRQIAYVDDHERLPLDSTSRMIVLGWILGLVIGLAIIVWSY